MNPAERVDLEFETWQELISVLSTNAFPGWIFRGIPNFGYSPLSKLERSLGAAGIPPIHWKRRENFGLAFFKERARHYLPDVPDERDLLSWLSLMQHYGAPTRLTDWTASPLVACYFAYESALVGQTRGQHAEEYAAIWALNAPTFCNVYGSKFRFDRDHTGAVPDHEHKDGKVVHTTYPGRTTTTDDVLDEQNTLLREAMEKEINWPLPLPILRPDKRMAAQQACFVCSGKLSNTPGQTAIELLMNESNWDQMAVEMNKIGKRPGAWLSAPNVLFDSHGKHFYPFQKPFLVVKKIKLPCQWRNDVMASLANMNITADTLFPGLDGLGRTTEIFMQTDAPSSMRQYLGL